MAIKARLLVDGEFYNLKSFNYGFKNGANSNGFSSSKTRQNGLTCVIEAIRQEYFEEWAMEDRMKKYIEVHISHGVDGMGRTRVLKCHDTFLLELYTRFSSTSNEPISFELFMKSGAIEASWSTAAHVEEWSSLPTNEGEVTVIEEELEPELVNYYITDTEGNKIEESSPGQKIVLNVITKNLKGELLTLDLENSTADYKYNGEVLINDTLQDYSIRNDHEKIVLEVISQELKA